MAHPWVIGHRGASAHAPENTLAAFRRAVELGASAVEMDLRVTRDGKVVLLHDARVNRTTDGHGRIDQLSFGAVRKLDAGSWFDKEFAGERVPTLEEALALAAELNVWLYLELKIPLEGSLPFALAEQLRRSRRLDRVVLLSFDPAALSLMRTTDPRLLTGLLVGRAGPTVEAARRAEAQLVAPDGRAGARGASGRGGVDGEYAAGDAANARARRRRHHDGLARQADRDDRANGFSRSKLNSESRERETPARRERYRWSSGK
jgi:glycerophosphoryl diester phosphodiesterase